MECRIAIEGGYRIPMVSAVCRCRTEIDGHGAWSQPEIVALVAPANFCLCMIILREGLASGWLG
jgi:hypothetical protein